MFFNSHRRSWGGLISFARIWIESAAYSAGLLFAHEVRHKIKLVLPQPEFRQLLDAVQTHFYHQGHKHFLVDEISVYDIGRQHCSRDVGHRGGHVAAAAIAAACATARGAAGAAGGAAASRATGGAATAAVLGVAISEVLVRPVHLVACSRVQIRHVVVVGVGVMVEILVIELLQLHAGRQGASLAGHRGPHELGVVKPGGGGQRTRGVPSVHSSRPHRVPDTARGIHVARSVVYVLAHQGVEGVLGLLLLVVMGTRELPHAHTVGRVVVQPVGAVGEAPVVHGHHMICHFQSFRLCDFCSENRGRDRGVQHRLSST